MDSEERQLTPPEALAERLSRGESKLVPIEQLKPNFWNPNQLGERQSEALGEAIDEHGFLDELLVRPHPAREGEYEVIDGEHRYWKLLDYADQLNDPTLAIPVRVIEADDPEAKKLTIIMNETRGRADRVDLAKLLATMADSGEYGDAGENVAVGLPFSREEVQEMIVMARDEWGDYSSDWTPDSEAGGAGGDGSSEDQDETPPDLTKITRFEVHMEDETFDTFDEAVLIGDNSAGDPDVEDSDRYGAAIRRMVYHYLNRKGE